LAATSVVVGAPGWARQASVQGVPLAVEAVAVGPAAVVEVEVAVVAVVEVLVPVVEPLAMAVAS